MPGGKILRSFLSLRMTFASIPLASSPGLSGLSKQAFDEQALQFRTGFLDNEGIIKQGFEDGQWFFLLFVPKANYTKAPVLRQVGHCYQIAGLELCFVY